MKTKRIIVVVLTVIMLLGIIQSAAYAADWGQGDTLDDALSELKVGFDDTMLDWLVLPNLGVIYQRYSYFIFRNNRTGINEEHPVYCIDPTKGGAHEIVRDIGPNSDGSKTATYIRGERVGDARYKAIMSAGFPHMMFTGLGLQNREEAYYATKLALWMYIRGNDPSSLTINPKYGNSDPAALRVRDAAVRIYNSGTKSNAVREPSLTLTGKPSATAKLDANGQYFVQGIAVYASGWIGTNPDGSGDVQLSWDSPPPASTIILGSNGEDISSTMAVKMTGGNGYNGSITIKYPASEIDPDTFSPPTLTATAIVPNDEIYVAYAKVNKDSYQRYLVERDPKIELSASFVSQIVVPWEEPPPSERGLRIRKVQAGTNIPLAGAVFEIRDPEGRLIYSMATDSSGIIDLPLSVPGNYTVTEITPPEYHLLSKTRTQSVYVRYGEVAEVTFTNEPYGALRLVKRDAANGMPLGGATVRIRNITTNTTQEMHTDSSGSAVFEKLPVGAYEIVEITAPSGYALDTATHTVNVMPLSEGETSYTLTNRANPRLRITKFNRQTMTPIAGVTFEIWRDGELYGTYVTNTWGEIELRNIPAGTYTAREVATVAPYVLDSTAQWIEIKAGQGHVSELIFFNLPKPGIRLLKIDSTAFIPLINARFLIKQMGGTFAKEFTTDANGEINLSELEPGAYTVQELNAPNGYLIDGTMRTIQINPGETAQFVFTNSKKPSLELVKYDPANSKNLGGATFRIAKIQDGSRYLDRITDINGRIRIDDLDPGIYSVQELSAPSGYILDSREYHVELFPGKTSQIVIENVKKPSLIVWKYDEQTAKPLPDTEFSIAKKGGSVIYEGLTNNEGFIRLDNLDEGWHTITEMAPPPGYLPSAPASKDVYLYGGATVEIKFDNLACPVLTISKVDRDTLKPLGSVRFNVKFSPSVNFSGGVVDLGEYVTDTNGQIILNDKLKSGWYRVTELAPPPGYVLGDPASKDIFLAGGESKTLVFENIKKPSLIIWKYDMQTAGTLKNAEFSIRKKDGAVIFEGVTDADGKITLDDLDPGYYTITEMAPPPGYLLAVPASRDVHLKPGQVLEVKYDNLKCPSLMVYKKDSVTGDPIKGVKMNVKFSPDVNFTGGVVNIGDFITDESGRILLDNDLKAGWYRVTEYEAAAGYILKEPIVQDIFLAGGEDKVMYFENIPKSALVIRKVDLNGSPLQGATFTIKYLAGTSGSGGTLIKTAVTGVNGIITITGLAPGTYIIEETIPAPGHQLSNPASQTAFINDSEQCVVELVFANPKMGRLVIEKRSNAPNHLPVAGVTFKVTDSSGAVIGPNNGLYTTDATGQIVINEWLQIGSTVIVTEVSGPADYNLDAPPQTVKIMENTTHTLTFYNSPKSGLQIIKTAAGSKTGLKDAHFRVIKSSGEIVGDYVTDKDGIIVVPNLEPGWYKAYETKAPDGYQLDDTPKDFQITGNQFVRLDFENVTIGGLEILKIDEETRRPVPNTEFSITKMNGERISANTYITDAHGIIRVHGLADGWYTITEVKSASGYILDPTPRNVEVKNGAATPLRLTNRKESGILLHKVDSITGKGIYGVKFLISDANNNPVRTVETDQNGYLYTTGLTDGKYLIREIEAARGYILDTEVKTFYVLYGSTQEITWRNTPTMGQIQITKKSADDNPVNGFPAGTLLQGAVFEIYDRANNLVDTVRSDRNGLAVSKTLPLGRYTIREVTAPVYYLAAQETVDAEIEFSGQIIRVTVLNKSVYTNVSVTKRGYTEVVPGQSIRYDFRNIANNSTVPLDSFYWRDTLPTDAVRLDKIITGTWSARLSYKVVYKTNLSGDDYKTLADNLSTDKMHTIAASPAALGLASNEFVTEFMFVFGRVPAGFKQVEAPYIFCNVLAGLPHEYRFTNKTDVGGLWGSQWIMANDRWVSVVFSKTTPPKLPRTGF